MEALRFGEYQVIKKLGKGTLGTTYLCEHQLMKKLFVLKLLPKELAAYAPFIKAFEEEVKGLSAIDHPRVAKIYNILQENGCTFFVSEAILQEGQTSLNVSEFLSQQERTLSETWITSFLTELAAILDEMHKMRPEGTGYVHRCLKPNNLLLDQHGKVVLTDWGLSKLIGPKAVLTWTYKYAAEAIGISFPQDEKHPYRHTLIDRERFGPLHQSFLQTFAFLAPEQKQWNQRASVTYKADIFAFGVLAYFLLTGSFPEGVPELPEGPWKEVLEKTLHPDPEKRVKELMPFFEEKSLPPPVTAIHSEGDASGSLRPVLRTQKIERPSHDVDPALALQVDPTVKQYRPKSSVIEKEPIQTPMVVVQGGKFIRGSNEGKRDEMPKHIITLPSFAIDVHPVTNQQFVRFLEAMGGEKDHHHRDIIILRDSRIKRSAGELLIESGYSDHPVVGVTWYGALAYAEWVGKRLPTEAEWEIAARGGKGKALYPTGQQIDKALANFFSSDTTPVKQYPPNPIGLYDMAGNVYEWCSDWYGYNYYEASAQEPNNPKGPLQGVYRVLRGGCWKSLKEDLGCSCRHRNNPGTVNGTYGFRCATDVE